MTTQRLLLVPLWMSFRSVSTWHVCLEWLVLLEEDDEWTCMVGLTLLCVFVHPPLLLIDGILPRIFSNDESVVEDTKDQATVEESVGKTDGIVLAKSEFIVVVVA